MAWCDAALLPGLGVLGALAVRELGAVLRKSAGAQRQVHGLAGAGGVLDGEGDLEGPARLRRRGDGAGAARRI
jgi:hypothetical protein